MNKKTGVRRHALLTAALSFLVSMIIIDIDVIAFNDGYSGGSGTWEDPFQIATYEDFVLLRNNVDAGETYSGVYFAQTADVSFPDMNWNPIGSLADSLAFSGFYDGQGHLLFNVRCNDTYAGVFSLLDGTVCNLGIESGRFLGDYIGSITSHGTDNARIVNCYNNAEVCGNVRSGGIADNLCGGSIGFSWNLGELTDSNMNNVKSGIVSYTAGVIENCRSSGDMLVVTGNYSGEISDSTCAVEDDIFSISNEYYLELADYPIERALIPIVVDGEHVRFSKEMDIKELRHNMLVENSVDYATALQSRFVFSGGSGTKNDPFLISCYEDLCNLRNNVAYGSSYSNMYFQQTADIIFPNENWKPIGSVTDELAFSGLYDGQGYVLQNIRCDDAYAGFFSLLDGTVCNLGIESGRFSGDYIGSITSHGTPNARIINCYNGAEVCGTSRAGGIADNLGGEVALCWNFGEVLVEKGNLCSVAAEICSYTASSIQNCYATGKAPMINVASFDGEVRDSIIVPVTDIDNTVHLYIAALNRFLEYEEEIVQLIPIESGDHGLGYSLNRVRKTTAININIVIGTALAMVSALLAMIWLTIRTKHDYGSSTTEPKKGNSSDLKEEGKIMVFPRKQIRRKRMCAVFATVFFISTGFVEINRIMIPKVENGILNYTYYRKRENQLADIFIVGTSAIAVAMDTATLWDQFGIAGYNLSTGGGSYHDVYYRLLEAFKVHVPRLVILDANPATYSKEQVEYLEYRNFSLLPMMPSANKFKLITATLKPDYWDDYLLSFPIFHNRFFNLDSLDIMKKSTVGEHFKDPGSYYNPINPSAIKVNTIAPLDFIHILDESEFFLRRIISLCKENSVSVIICATPTYYSEKIPYYNALELVADELGVDFMNLNLYKQEWYISSADYCDGIHLSTTGARKCAEIMGKHIAEHYEIEDHRGNFKFESWDLWREEREDNYLRQILKSEDYFRELRDYSRKVVAIPFGLTDELPDELEMVSCNLDTIQHTQANIDYGESDLFYLGSYHLMIDMGYKNCSLKVNGVPCASISTPGWLFVVYDEVTGDLVEVIEISSENEYVLKHHKVG